MIYALNQEGVKIQAKPKLKASCPGCQQTVIAKCGEINQWHWAHKNSEECDSFKEGETDWHICWKLLIHPTFTEVIIGKHRADILTGLKVIELQNSHIDVRQIKEREAYYKNLIWLFNGEDFYHNFDLRGKEGYVTFRWKWSRKHISYCTAPVYIDFGKEIIYVKKFYNEGRSGWGYLITKEKFIMLHLKPVLKVNNNE